MLNRTLKWVTHLLVLLVFLMGIPVSADQGKININTADEKQLCTLARVGPKYAARIIKYRKEVGEFKHPEEIMQVRGIGEKTFVANKELIIVAEEAEPEKKIE